MIFRAMGKLSQGPAPLTLAANLASSAAAVVRAAAAGDPIRVSAEVRERRLAICRGCVEYWEPTLERCTHLRCGCFMRVKTWANALTCPDGRW